MKIAVASEKDLVSPHFGHCPDFNIFEVKNGRIVNHEILANPGHSPGFLPNHLHDMGVNVVISGGMGGKAVNLFNERGIKVITGVSGRAETAVNSYLQGKLESTGSVCQEHLHCGECGH